MNFFKKRWVAVVLCIVMVIAAIGISVGRNRQVQYEPESSAAAEDWGEENYASFTQFIHDEAGMLSDSAIREISEHNAALDYSYASICGLVILEDLDGRTMEDAAYDMSVQLELGENDALLLIDMGTEDWYFAYGGDFSYYVNNELEVLMRGGMNGSYSKLDSMLPGLFEELEDWYDDYMPVADQAYTSSFVSAGAGAGLFALFVILIVVIVVFSAIGRLGRRVTGGWGPVFFVGGRRHRPFFHHNPMHGPGSRPNPGPRRNPGPRPTHNRSAGRSGGFGGSSRGSGFGGRGGGFGGGSRGGGFGGRR